MNKAKDKTWVGWAAAILAITALSTTSPIGRAGIQAGMNPTTLLLGRFVLASLLLGITLRATIPGGVHIDRRGLLMCGAAGLVSGLTALFYFWALSRISASIASMIFSLYPLAALSLLALRGEKFTYRNIIRLGLGISGVFLLIGPGGHVDGLGVLLALLAASNVAIFLAITQWFLHGYPPRVVAFYVVTTMTIVVFGFWLVQGAEWHQPGWKGWLAIAALAVVSTYLARLAIFRAIHDIGSGQYSLLAPLESLLAVFWAVLFLQERLSAIQWLGGGLILISTLLAVKRLRLARTQPPLS